MPANPRPDDRAESWDALDAALEALDTPERPDEVRVALHAAVAQLHVGLCAEAFEIVDEVRAHLSPAFVRAVADAFLRWDALHDDAVEFLATVADAATMRTYGDRLARTYEPGAIAAYAAGGDRAALRRIGARCLNGGNPTGFTAFAALGELPPEPLVRAYVQQDLAVFRTALPVVRRLIADGVPPPLDLLLPRCEADLRAGHELEALAAYDLLGVTPDPELLLALGRAHAARESTYVAAELLRRAGAFDEAQAAATALVRGAAAWEWREGLTALALLGAREELAVIAREAFVAGETARVHEILRASRDDALAIEFGAALVRRRATYDAHAYFALAVQLRDAARLAATGAPHDPRA